MGLVKLIVAPLLAEEGYRTKPSDHSKDYGIDLIADRPANEERQQCRIGIANKHYFHGQKVDVSEIEKSLAFLIGSGLSRALIVVNTPFTEHAREVARRASPGTVELLDVNGLRAWVGRVDVESDVNVLEIEQILKVTSNRLAKRIAEEPDYLDRLDWWHIEQLVADLFAGLGFDVTLTPSSKDDGKDVIVEFVAKGKTRTYVIEIKHWRSGKGVGKTSVTKFLNVLVREKRDGGLFLSTYGYANNAFESLTAIQRETLKFGEQEKIVTVCKQYLKVQSGIWSPPQDLSEVIFGNTV